jgi:vancomycin resistance protein YoaR
MAIIVGAVVAAVFAVLALASLVEHALYAGEVLPGVRVDGVDADGRSRRAVTDDVARLGAELARAPLRARAGGTRLAVEPALIGFDVDAEATAHRAVAAGRGGPLARVTGTLLRRIRPDRVPLRVRYDEQRLEGLLDGWAASLDRGVVEGDLRFEGTTVVVVEPRAGTGLLRAEARETLRRALGRPDRTQEVSLPVGEVVPKVGRAAVDAAAARARALLAVDREIIAADRRLPLTAAQLAGTLGTRVRGTELDLVVDPDRLRLALGPGVAAFEQPPVNASFAVTASNTVTVVPSRDGRMLDLEAIAQDILRGERVVRAHVRDIHPSHDTEWATRLGIKRQVSSFTTYHAAGQPRVRNIHLAADALNNTVVEPGQTFSLNETLGPRTPEKGYVKAPILVEDGFGEDYGGGVSQLTTTLYNAVFFGGYVDVEHAPHRFYISRYPMGREATINYPSVDLKFRNDTKYGVLVRTSYSDTAITVALYGDNEGRVVREENRRVVHTEPVTDELVTCPVEDPKDDPQNDCATLLAFERKTVQTGEAGYDVEFERVIEQPGVPTRRERYRVHYPMLPNKVLVGTLQPTTTTGPRTATSTTKTTLRRR